MDGRLIPAGIGLPILRISGNLNVLPTKTGRDSMVSTVFLIGQAISHIGLVTSHTEMLMATSTAMLALLFQIIRITIRLTNRNSSFGQTPLKSCHLAKDFKLQQAF